MSDLNEIKSLLIQIRDNQQQSLAKQEQHLTLVQQQLDEAKGNVEQSLRLQREAMTRVKSISKIALPAIVVCIAAIVYLVVRYL